MIMRSCKTLYPYWADIMHHKTRSYCRYYKQTRQACFLRYKVCEALLQQNLNQRQIPDIALQ